jgi:8-oxo-(d)GTP phosphatase
MENPQQQVVYIAAGGVVLHGSQVLVLYRPERDEFRLPKGHIEAGEDVSAAARREVMEESGYEASSILADLGEQLVEFNFQGQRYVRTERYFLMALSSDAATAGVRGEAQFEPLWLTFDEALTRLTFESEREWMHRAKRRFEELQLKNISE